jgi:hypothetical protein
LIILVILREEYTLWGSSLKHIPELHIKVAYSFRVPLN